MMKIRKANQLPQRITPVFRQAADARPLLVVMAILALGIQCAAQAAQPPAVPAIGLLNTIGINTTLPNRGQRLDKTIDMIRYGGFRWVRGGIEGMTEKGPTTLQTYLDLHKSTGVLFSMGLLSGGTDVPRLITTGRQLAQAGALLAFEGCNEPNNWAVKYEGEAGGGKASWLAVAKLHRDLYQAVKGDPLLAKYPVFSTTETGGESDNVGLQFLKIPDNADTLMPPGTQYADYANCHNYIYHPRSPKPADNKTWDDADPSPVCQVDGLYGDFGRTWAKHFKGYSQDQLDTLPRVTTETGTLIDRNVTEQTQALNLLTMYLDQFKRGWSYTAVYLLRDRTDEAGNQTYGFFDRDYKPRTAAIYLHNLTTILADDKTPGKLASLDYTISDQPGTVHDLALQKSDGRFALVIWDERVTGEDRVTVHLGQTAASIQLFDPTIGTEAVKTLAKSDQVELTLSNHPVVLLLGQ